MHLTNLWPGMSARVIEHRRCAISPPSPPKINNEYIAWQRLGTGWHRKSNCILGQPDMSGVLIKGMFTCLFGYLWRFADRSLRNLFLIIVLPSAVNRHQHTVWVWMPNVSRCGLSTVLCVQTQMTGRPYIVGATGLDPDGTDPPPHPYTLLTLIFDNQYNPFASCFMSMRVWEVHNRPFCVSFLVVYPGVSQALK